MTSSVLTDFEFAPFDIIDGDRGKNYPKQNDFSSEGHCLFLSATNVTKSGFQFSDCQFISEQKDAVLRKGKLCRGDVVLTTRGTIGNSAYYSDVIQYDHMRINSGMVILRCDTENMLPAYLYHFLRSPSFFGQVNSLRSGVAQPQLPIRDMKKIKLPLPSVKVQSQISLFLSAYDDLIENNRRRISLLEESARLLYREWFVHLRFPGHEHIKVVDGVPEGWERKTLGDVADTNASSYSSKNLPTEIRYIDIASVNRGRIESPGTLICQDAPGRARRIALHGDVIWSNVRPNLKAYALVLNPKENDVFSTGFTVLTPKDIPYSYLYLFTTTNDFVNYLVNHTTGASYPAVRPDDFERAEILIPPSMVLESFHKISEPLFLQIHQLELQSSLLAQARDHLLPKLMSGEIEV